jgi:hypothetical protein
VAAAVVNDASIQQGFFWSSHTFTHQNLDNATVQDTAAEVGGTQGSRGAGGIGGMPGQLTYKCL